MAQLTSIEINGTEYTLGGGVASSTDIGGIKLGYSQSGNNYPVVLNSSNQAYVNVPWSDTNTHYSSYLYLSSSSSATSQTTGTITSPYMNLVENGIRRTSIQFTGSNGITVQGSGSSATGRTITISGSGSSSNKYRHNFYLYFSSDSIFGSVAFSVINSTSPSTYSNADSSLGTYIKSAIDNSPVPASGVISTGDGKISFISTIAWMGSSFMAEVTSYTPGSSNLSLAGHIIRETGIYYQWKSSEVIS